MRGRTVTVTAAWDAEAGVWVAQSEDVPGLVTEAASLDALLARLRTMIPELLELNDGDDLPEEVPFELLAKSLSERTSYRG